MQTLQKCARYQNILFNIGTDAESVDGQEDIFEILACAEFVLETWHIEENFLEYENPVGNLISLWLIVENKYNYKTAMNYEL